MAATLTNKKPEASGPYALDEQIGFILRKVSQRHTSIFTTAFGSDLTAPQWATLAKLFENGPTSQNQLGRLVALDAATIKGVVDRLAAHQDLVVQVRTGGASGVAGEGDDLPALDLLTLLDTDLLQMPIEGAQVVAVVEDHGGAVLAPVAREVDRAGSRGEHRGAPMGADVEAAVELGVARPR